MDRAGIARAGRRRQALEALEFERDRTAALRDQLETIVTELDGPGIDAAAFATMAAEDVDVVRATFEPSGPLELDEELSGEAPENDRDVQAEREEQEAEIVRLEEEIASSGRRQQAFERYIEALGR